MAKSSIASRKFSSTVVPGVTVDTSLRSGADAASGDRAPTASGDREQDLLDWLQPFTEGLVDGESGSSGCWCDNSQNTSFTYSMNKEGSTNYSPIFRRTPIVRYARTQKSQALHAEGILKVEKTGYSNIHIFWIQLQHITKFSTKRTSGDCIIGMRLWFKIWVLNGHGNKTAQETMRRLQRFLPPESKPGVVDIDNSLEFTKSLRRSVVESRQIHPTSIRNEWNCGRSCHKSKRRDFDSVSPIRIG